MLTKEQDQRVRWIVAETLGVNLHEVTNDADLQDHLGADSLDRTTLLMRMEEEFNLPEIHLDETDDIYTVSNLLSFLNRKLGNECGSNLPARAPEDDE